MEPPTPSENRIHSFPPKIQTSFPSQAHLNPALARKIHEMSLPLAPFVQMTTGQVHPAFPQTLLHFWLLTDDQLDSLASFYHQRSPCEWTRQYPCPISWHAGLTLKEKRRKIGKFIGLRGCETPIMSIDEHGRFVWGRTKTEEEIMEDARQARLRNEEDEIRRKMGWY